MPISFIFIKGETNMDKPTYKILYHSKEEPSDDVYGQCTKQYRYFVSALRKANKLFDTGLFDRVEIQDTKDKDRFSLTIFK